MTDALAVTAIRDVEFDPHAASVDAVQRAAYRLSDRMSVDIQVGDSIACTVFVTDADDADAVLASFRNEVLDQVLRERIREETAAARNLILALAFSQTGSFEAS